MRRDTYLSGKPINIFKNVRDYLSMSQDEIAQKLGITKNTWYRWESGIISQPGKKNLKKLMKIVQKRAEEIYRKKFLEWVVYDKNFITFGKTEGEIIEEIERKFEEFKKSPIIINILKEHPEYKNLPFYEIFKNYTKGKLDINGIFIINQIASLLNQKNRSLRKNTKFSTKFVNKKKKL